ncbi:MAG TPA: septum formation family protein [Mycobacteriales bacterium]|nr:septum formation family protein [Mycobacteriales bacterium]
MTDSGPEQNPFAPPDPSRPPPPPLYGDPPAGASQPPPPPSSPPAPPYGQPPLGPPPPAWAHPQLQQPWQQNPWVQPASEQRQTSALAVAALVTAVIALVPLALVLSIAALVRMKNREQRGTGLVLGALSVAAGWSALVALFLVVGVLGGYDPHSRGRLAVLPATKVGTCLDAGLRAVEDCSVTHDLEVFFSPTLPNPVWPGTSDVGYAADSLCEEAFKGYVGTSYQDSELDYEFYAPTEAEWGDGKHQVVCVITPAGDSLVGSVKGSGR